MAGNTDSPRRPLKKHILKKGFSDPIMLRDLLTQKCSHKKKLLILDTPEHVDSEKIKLKIGPLGPVFLY
jgi:hypothetical protein